MPSNKPSIYPYLAAGFIEQSEAGSTAEAIRFITQEELKGLKNKHKREQELKVIMKEVHKREDAILNIFGDLDKEGGSIIYNLNNSTKVKITILIADILYLYERRNGKESAEKFRNILQSNADEPYLFMIYYGWDKSKGRFYIKGFSLVSTENPPEENEEKMHPDDEPILA